ncbi:hypothetical protein NPIL_429231 [Nephila pilipes]|uniref:Uncharacterized protein n=1 Tax=Nephila pilipes TaxID=299642 RepID=A0A8X6Q688_NEPPI|nr:hypothetical protein NPIL_429231 [Nephila pilipes]
MFPIDPGCSRETGVFFEEGMRMLQEQEEEISTVRPASLTLGDPPSSNAARALFASGDETFRSHKYEIKWKRRARPTRSGSSNYFKICFKTGTVYSCANLF